MEAAVHSPQSIKLPDPAGDVATCPGVVVSGQLLQTTPVCAPTTSDHVFAPHGSQGEPGVPEYVPALQSVHVSTTNSCPTGHTARTSSNIVVHMAKTTVIQFFGEGRGMKPHLVGLQVT